MNATVPVPFRFEIETPRPLQAPGCHLRLQGWCLAPSATTAPRMRLVAGTHILGSTSIIDRPDVVALLGAAATATACGFVLEGRLPPGAWLATLEASAEGRPWQRVCELSVASTAGELKCGIEFPTGPVVKESVRIQGWCAHPELPVAEVWLHYGNRRIRCDYGLPRTDVPGLLPHSPDAARAGFIAPRNIRLGLGPLQLRAVTTTGETFFAATSTFIDVDRDVLHPAPLDLHGELHRLGPARRATETPAAAPAGNPRRILFALYGDFTANSALHVASLANRLAALGHECVVAVPHHVETVRYHPDHLFQAVLFADCLKNPGVFAGGRPADIVHAWTTRENVRGFCEAYRAKTPAHLVVHLEDHESRILEASVGRSSAELLALPPAELDALVPAILSHPRHGRSFLESADAVTVIVDRLRELVPAGKPVQLLWPAADETVFFPRPVPRGLRRALDWEESHTVLFYHGNVHATNAAEVRELYAAVLALNGTGTPTSLLRVGRDEVDFLGDLAPAVAPHVVNLGRIEHHHHLAPLLALADFFVQPGAPDAFNDYRFPSKLPEFFALGRPVILPRTNLGELLRHGEDAWILDRADAAGIAGAVRALRADPAMVARLAAGAQAVANARFNWQRTAETLLGFYNSLPLRA
ncbi:MAG TPA: glycosyltransferase family 4 protein [Lacunisphaera sp.]